MIECPWCSSEIHLDQNVCPVCHHEVLADHLNPAADGQDSYLTKREDESEVLDLEMKISNEFNCTNCGHNECDINEVAMTGAGLSKVLNIQYHHYLFVSCLQCASVAIFDPSILRNR